MKSKFILALLAIAPALLAAEPNSARPVESTTNAPAGPEDIADQAALVQQIGEEAARGFDAEAHAHALRVQMEALVAQPLSAKAPVLTESMAAAVAASSRTPVKPPTVLVPSTGLSPSAGTAAAQPRDAAIRAAIQKVRTVLNELETQLAGKGQ